MLYVIMRTDQGGGYLAHDGSTKAYTQRLQDARTFKSREYAMANRCPENEVVVSLEDAVEGNRL